MNTRNILMAGLMLVWTGIARAADVLSVQEVEVALGESATLSVGLNNGTSNLMGWQCDIVLPEGLSLELKANGKPSATLGERFATTGHTISSNQLPNGAYRFIATSMDGEAIPGTSGTLFTVTLKADAALAERAGTGPAPTLTGKVTNVEFNTQDNQKLTFDDVTFSVTIAGGALHASDILKVDDARLTAGESVTLGIELENVTTNLMGWQCDIVLPEGLSLELKANGKPAATLGERFSTTGHTISSSQLSNGAYRIIATSMDGEAIPGTSGTLFTVTLKADAALAERAGTGPAPTLTGKVTNVEFNTQDNQKLTFDDVTFSVNILDDAPHDSDMLKVADTRLTAGGSVTLGVELKNVTMNLMGWQCDIVLSEGLSLELKANGKPAATLGERFSTTGHTISSSQLSNGAYRIIATSMDGEAIPGTSGTLFTVTLKADAALAERAGTGPAPTLTGKVTNVEFNTQDNQKLTFDEVTFSVTIAEEGLFILTYNLSEGWNWLSTNLTDEKNLTSLLFLKPIEDDVVRMQSQTQELVNDGAYGLVGNLQTLKPGAGYKLQVKNAATLTLTGEAADVATPVHIYKGWNWLGYLPTVSLPVTTALENLEATKGDRIVWQDGFAEFDGTAWTGDFLMEPGKGYMYYAGKEATLVYSSAASGNANSRSDSDLSGTLGSVPHYWQYDQHRYPDVMTLVAQLETSSPPQGGAGGGPFTVGAFCGDECRGIGRWVGDKLFVTVHGTIGLVETVTFRAYEPMTGEEMAVDEAVTFNGQYLGSLGSPMVLHVGNAFTTISDQWFEGGIIRVYSPSGRQLQNLRKGVNILVKPNGSAKKELRTK